MSKRIAFISEHASPLALLGGTDSGGQNVYVAELSVQLVKQGYQIDIYTRWDDPYISQVVNYEPGVRIIHIQAGPLKPVAKEELLSYMHDFYMDMLGFINEQEIFYSLIHANFWMSGLVAMQLKAELNIPFVITFHALGYVRKIYQKESDKFPPERLIIEEEIVRQADHIIAECPQDRDDLILYYEAKPENITIIPCGFNKDEFYPVDKAYSRNLLKLGSHEMIILQLGRMVPRKGIDNVIRALALIDNSEIPVSLVIVGGENNSDQNLSAEHLRLLNLVKDLKLSDRVVFTGRKERDELKYYYAAADLFITTPWYEPFGITPLESMACGTPVIGAAVGGIKYSVIDGETGFLVPPDCPAALSEKIIELLTNKLLMIEMGRNAVNHVHLHYTWQIIASKMKNLYEEVLQKDIVIDKELLNVIKLKIINRNTTISYLNAKGRERHKYGS